MASTKDHIVGLDIGSANIRIAVGEVSPDSERVSIIGLAEGSSSGVSKGNVRSIEEVAEAINLCLHKAEKMTAMPISSAYVSISGSHITSQQSRGVIAVSRADGEIQEDDIERVLDAAQAVSVPPNYEILHVLPRTFSIDNQTGIKDPIGMTGVRLEVEAHIIEGQSSHIKNVTKAVNLAGLNIKGLVLASLAASESALTERQKDLGVAMVNIGAATTSVLVFEEGDILQASVLPVGSAHITNDIAIGLRTNIDIAEEIKIRYGQAVPGAADKREEVNLNTIDEQEEGTFSTKHVSEIIEARVEEIFRMVDKKLREVNRSGKLPAGVVLTGGGANLPGLAEVAKREFRLPAVTGVPGGAYSAIDKISDPGLTTAVGLVLFGYQNQVETGGRFGSFTLPQFGKIGQTFRSLAKMLKF